MDLMPISELSEDEGEVILIKFGRENGEILGEAPTVSTGSFNDFPQIDEKWEYFIEVDWDSLFEKAEEIEDPTDADLGN